MSIPLRAVYVRYTSCSGCQLMLTNCEAELPVLTSRIDWVRFELISSAVGDLPIDLALVEGSITRVAELDDLLALRRRARALVAVGSCALSGGVNALLAGERDRSGRAVYGDDQCWPQSFPAQPVARFVAVDAEIVGCPPERDDFLALFDAVRCGGWPPRREVPVCMECRIRENRCLLMEERRPCLGPVTLGGCGARCPSANAVCEGCRGTVAEANRDELCRLLLAAGMAAPEIQRRMARFSGGDHD